MNMRHANELLRNLANSPTFFPEEVDFEKLVVNFCRMDRTAYQRSAFLDERKVRLDRNTYKVRLDYLLNTFGENTSALSPINWIFHTPHSGSTLIARALDELNGCFSLKEPVLLIQASSLKRHPDFKRLERTGDWKRFFSMVLALLSRTFESRETVLIKTTSVCHNLVNDIFSGTRSSRGLFLYSSLEKYLISLYKGDHLDAYLNAGFTKALHDISPLHILDPGEAESLPRNRQVAILWLSIVLNLNNYTVNNPDKHIVTLDCHHFFSERMTSLQALAEHFRYPCDESDIDEIINGPIFTRDAKSEKTTWDENEYSGRNESARSHFSAEIEDALLWVEGLTRDAEHSLPAPIFSAET